MRLNQSSMIRRIVSKGAIWSNIGNGGRYVEVELGVIAAVDVDVGEVEGRSASVCVRPITYLHSASTIALLT